MGLPLGAGERERGPTQRESFRKRLTRRLTSLNFRELPPWNFKTFLSLALYLALFSLLLSLMIYYFPKSDNVCFARVGCFPISGPWSQRPSLFNFSPQSPTVINTVFIITSRRDSVGQSARATSPISLEKLKTFPWGSHDIVLIIHGFTDDSSTWMKDLRDILLNLADVTVVLVDWSFGASGHYPQIVANTRVVAREITIFLRQIKKYWTTPKRIHLFGHSLGSHIASYVGKAQKTKLFQIVSLDPAFPLFEGFPPEIRLHHTDAENVLVIHSNTGPWGLGMKDPVGTVDIYLNDGRDQRGCTAMSTFLTEPLELGSKGLVAFTNLKDRIACSHRRAYEVLSSVLKNIQSRTMNFLAYPMEATNNSVQTGFCDNKKNHCWRFKWNDKSFLELPKTKTIHQLAYFLPTTDANPFCAQMAFLEMTSCTNEPWSSPSEILEISYSAFGDVVSLFKGKLHGKQKIESWLELSCRTPMLKESEKLFRLKFSVDSNNMVAASRSGLKNSRFCALGMQLTYFNILTRNYVKLKPLPSKNVVKVIYNTCYEIVFNSFQ